MKFVIEPVDSRYSLSLEVPHTSGYIKLYVSSSGSITPLPDVDNFFETISDMNEIIARIEMIWSPSPPIHMLVVSDIEYWIDKFNKFPFEYLSNFPLSPDLSSNYEDLKNEFNKKEYSQFDRYIIYNAYKNQYDQTVSSIRKRYPTYNNFKLWDELDLYTDLEKKSLRYYIKSIVFPESMQHEFITKEVSAIL